LFKENINIRHFHHFSTFCTSPAIKGKTIKTLNPIAMGGLGLLLFLQCLLLGKMRMAKVIKRYLRTHFFYLWLGRRLASIFFAIEDTLATLLHK
jgi:hypothetical protein